MQSSQILYALPFILLFVALRLWRGSRARALKVERMWIRPLIILAILGLTISADPPPPNVIVYAALAIAAVVGFAFGWWRGRMVRISIDVNTHALTSQQSPWSLLVLIAIIAVRLGVRYALQGQHEIDGVPVSAIIDGVTILYGGNIVGMQLEQWLRARKLLSDTIAAKAAGKATPAEVTQAHAGDAVESGHGPT
jgi:hypothetical protein